MYYRVRASTEQHEPRDLFHLIEFVMIDVDDSGTIDLDEAMNIFRTRYGKGALDAMLRVFAERAAHRGIATEFAMIRCSDFLSFVNNIESQAIRL
jgi:hypothetical protein